MGEMFAFSNICRFSYINSHTRKQINTLLPKIKVFHFLLLRMFKLFCFSSGVDTNGSSHPVGHWDHIPATNPLVKWWAITQEQSHRSTTPKLATPTAPPCMDNIIHTLWSSRRHEPGCDAPVGNHSITRRSGTRSFIQGWPVDRWAPGARSHYRTPETVAPAMAAWWHAPLVRTDGHNKRKQNSDNPKGKDVLP